MSVALHHVKSCACCLCRAHGQNAIVDAYLLHVINHVNTSALRIKKHNDALKAGKDSEAPRDQGFCRAKVPPSMMQCKPVAEITDSRPIWATLLT